MAQKSDKKSSGVSGSRVQTSTALSSLFLDLLPSIDTGIARGGGKAGKGGKEEDEEDYGDYVTRCICGYTHDDGFMVQCDGCRFVWSG